MSTPVIIEVRANVSQAQKSFDGLGRSISNFGKQVRSIVAMSSQAMTGVRQMAQGVQNLGFVLSGLVGIPVAAAFKSMSSEILDFEEAMVEVQKTTGITSEGLKVLSGEIRQMALATPTSATELANLAAAAGRAGVGLEQMASGNIAGAREEILRFIEVVDKMQVATTLNVEEAATAFGRFMTVFKGIDTKNIENLGSAINELGQSASVTEDEIVGAMLRIAPAAATLGMTAQDVAALATGITQMSESMSRGGTRVRTALEQMVDNWEVAAKLIGVSQAEMTRRLNEDALGVFLELIYAIGQVEDNTKQLAYASEIFGTTGSNAVQRFAASFPELQKFMAISNQAFREGTSLQVEFDRALGATNAQLKILRDNVVEAGMKFAEDLLPVAKEILSALIPAVQALGEWLGGLSMKTKLLAVAFVGIAVVGFPLLALFGSIGFAFSMMLNGIVNLVGGLVGLAATVLTLGSGMSFLNLLLGGLVAIIGGTLLVAVLKATGAFDGILEKLREVSENGVDWGEGLIANIAEGIIKAASTILANALEFVGNIISSFLEPGSPPDTGPLSTIDKWGKGLMDVYLQGFNKADFGILRDVTDIIRHVFTSLADIGKVDEANIGPMIMKARTAVAKLIDTFNQTGVISSEILGNLSKMLGEAGDEVARLIRLQLEYNSALKELEKIRQKKSDIEEAYRSEARAIQSRIDLTGAEKANLIRQAQGRRNIALANADTEEKAAQRGVDSLKDQLDWQKEYINALRDSDNVWRDHLKVLKRIAKAVSSVGKAIKDLLADLMQQLKINLQTQDLYKSKDMDTTPLLREELSLRKRIVKELMNRNDAIRSMEEPSEGDLLQLSENEDLIQTNLDRIKELEKMLDSTSGLSIEPPDMSGWDQASQEMEEMFSGITEHVKTWGEAMTEGKARFDAFIAGITGQEMPAMGQQKLTGKQQDLIGRLSPKDQLEALRGWNAPLEESRQKFYDWGQKIAGVKDTVVGAFDSIIGRFDAFKAGLSGGELPTELVDMLGETAENLYNAGESIRGFIEMFTGEFENMKENVRSVGEAVGDDTLTMGDKFEAMKKLAVPALIAVAGAAFVLRKPLMGLIGWLDVGGAFSAISGGAGTAANMLEGLAGISAGVGGTVAGAISSIGSAAGGAVAGGVSAAAGTFKLLGNRILDLRSIAQNAPGVFSTINQSVTGLLGPSIASKLSGNMQALLDILYQPASRKVFIEDVLLTIRGAITGFPSSAASSVAGGIGGILEKVQLFAVYARSNPGMLLGSIGGGLKSIAAAGLPAIGSGLLGIGSAIGGAIASIATFIGTITGIGGIIAAAGAIIYVTIDYIKEHWNDFKDAFIGAYESIKAGVMGFVESFKEALGIGDGVGELGDLLNELKTKAEPIARFLAGVLAKSFEVLGKVIQRVLPPIGKVIGSVLRGIGVVAAGIIDAISGVIEIFAGFFDWLGGDEQAGERMLEGLKQLGQGILEIFAGLLGPIINTVGAIFEFVVNIFKDLVAEIGGAFQDNAIVQWIIWLFEEIVRWAEWLYNIMVGKSIIPDLVNGMIGWINKLVAPFKSVFDTIGGIISGAISTIKGILSGDVDLLEVLKNGFYTFVTWISTWVTDSAIPAISGFIQSVKTYLDENLPDWAKAVLGGLGEIVRKIVTWVTTEAIPAVSDFISGGIDELGRIATEWLSKVEEALDIVKGKFEEKFKAIADIIQEKIKDGINGLLGIIEKGVNNIINKINALIKEINKIATAVGLKPIKLIGNIELPRLARGGVALHPTIAMLAEAGEPEAIVPLSRLENMINADSKKGDFIVNVNNPVVRNDDDIDRIIKAVKYEIGLGLQNRNHGYGRGIG